MSVDLKQVYDYAVRYKLEQVKSHENYKILEKMTEDALIKRAGAGIFAMMADKFTDLVLLKPVEDLYTWLSDEEYVLEFTEDERKNRESLVKEAYTLIYNNTQEVNNE